MFENAHPIWLCRALLVGVVVAACDTTRRDTVLQSQKNTLGDSAGLSSPAGASTNTAAGSVAISRSAASSAPIPAPSQESSPPTDTWSSSTARTSPGSAPLATRATSSHAPREVKPTQPAVEAKPVQSPAHKGEGFVVYLRGTTPIRVGQTQPFTVVIEPQAPFKSNDKYPYRFAGLKAQAATLSADVVTGASVTPNRTTLLVNVTGASPGEGSLEGTLSFSVCTAEKCLVERASLKLAFEVTAND